LSIVLLKGIRLLIRQIAMAKMVASKTGLYAVTGGVSIPMFVAEAATNMERPA